MAMTLTLAVDALAPVSCLVITFFAILGIAASIFWVWMLIDALTNQPTTSDKLLWFLVIFFLHLLGAVIYYYVGRRPIT